MYDNFAITKKISQFRKLPIEMETSQELSEEDREQKPEEKPEEARVNDTINIGIDKMWRRYGRKTEMGKSNDKQ